MTETQKPITYDEKFPISEQIRIWKELEKRKTENPNLYYLQILHPTKSIVWVTNNGTTFPE